MDGVEIQFGTLSDYFQAILHLETIKLDLQNSRRALSLFQHHNGITGTAQNHVVKNYALGIHTVIRQCQDWMIRKGH